MYIILVIYVPSPPDLGLNTFEQFPRFLLAIHSSKRLLVEKVLPMPHILADAIILLTVAKGQRHEVLFLSLKICVW